MVYVLEEPARAKGLFDGWRETLIYSCLQGVMGAVFVTDLDAPASALARVGCFSFFAGRPERELAEYRTRDFSILVPRDDAWAKLIEETHPGARKVTRYAIRKDTRFDPDALRQNIRLLPDGCELREIDGELYDKCLEDPLTADFVASFAGKEAFLRDGRGVVIVKDGRIVSGASSFSRYREGIEIEVDTLPRERRKRLALICCSALILRCLEEDLYPSWDAQNMESVRLAEKLGYEFSHAYVAYELAAQA